MNVTISQGHLGVKLVEFSIAHISCSVSCIELKLGTNDEEGIAQQIIALNGIVLELLCFECVSAPSPIALICPYMFLIITWQILCVLI